MDGADLLQIGVPLALFAIAVSLLLYYWPRPAKVFLTRERKRAEVLDIVELSHDTKRFRLSLGSKDTVLGLPIGKHLVVYAPNPDTCLASGKWNGFPDPDKGQKEIERKYTPVTGNETPGYVDLIIKMYRPGVFRLPDGNETTWDDGGKLGWHLDSKRVGDFVEIRGPLGVNEYLGRGTFKLPGRTLTVKHIGMLAGGTGLTPMLQVITAALRDRGDTCTLSLIYANKTEDDILCKSQLDALARDSQGRFKLTYTVDFPTKQWKHNKGFITADMIKACFPRPSADILVLMCGPPPMVEFACKNNLVALGYAKASLLAF